MAAALSLGNKHTPFLTPTLRPSLLRASFHGQGTAWHSACTASQPLAHRRRDMAATSAAMAAHSQQEPQQQQQHGPRRTVQLKAVDISEESFRPFGQLIGPTDDGKEYDGEDAQLEGLGEGQPRWAGSCRQPALAGCMPDLCARWRAATCPRTTSRHHPQQQCNTLGPSASADRCSTMRMPPTHAQVLHHAPAQEGPHL